MYKCKHFTIKELVSKNTYDKWGEQAWMFFDEDILEDLDTIREAWGKPIIINNWGIGGSLSQCGLRANIDPLVKAKTTLYLSAHCMGKAFDLHASNGDNEGLYKLVQTLKFKAIKRLENFTNTPTWVHVDSFQTNISSILIF